mmetsp:Transcript_35008/g.25490  ORF Transcript_35008/g.25490 Transcript_35008/m.25490 type:complete len:220 (+) Transcript_35008:107-766(+)
MVSNRCLTNNQKENSEVVVEVMHKVKNQFASLLIHQMDAPKLSVNFSILKTLIGLVTCRITISSYNNRNLCMVMVNRCNNKIPMFRASNNNNQWVEDKEEIRKTFLADTGQIVIIKIVCSNTTLHKICNNNNLSRTNSDKNSILNRISKTSSNYTQPVGLWIRCALLLRPVHMVKTISVDNLHNVYVKESSAKMLIFLKVQTFSSVLCGRNNLFCLKNK